MENEYSRLAKSVDRVPLELRELAERVHGVIGRLDYLKKIARVSDAGSQPSRVHDLDIPAVRSELSRVRESITQFKTAIRSMSNGEDPHRLDEVARLSYETLRQRQRADDSSKPLIDRIGGELVLETFVELSYARFLQDNRVRAFFDQSLRKITIHKKRFFQFFLGYLGGKSTYEEANLKHAHYHLNITDYHFDTLIEIFQSVMGTDMKVHPAAVQDFVTALLKVRKDIVIGYTMRSEMARINTDRSIEILFNNMGGLEGVIKFIDRFYDLLSVDIRVRKVFEGRDLDHIKNAQLAFITELIGGPRLYKGPALEDVHKNLGLDDYHFDCYLQDAEKALQYLELDQSVIDQVVVQLESMRAVVLGRQRGAAQIFHQHASNLSGGSAGVSPIPSVIDLEAESSPLIVRLGGEKNVAAIVDILFRGCVTDPRLRYFFLPLKQRQEKFKRNFTNSIISVAGGTVFFDLTQLKKIHFGLNITNYHFDSLMSNLADACRLCGVPANAGKELVNRLSKLRSEITSGCTIRLEMAQQRTEGTDNSSPMCWSLGGSEGINRVIEKLYEAVLQDVRITHFFIGAKMESILKSQAQFIANLFGANGAYKGRDIVKVHSVLNVTDYHFDCFVEHVAQAVRACGYTDDTADECTVLIETTRNTIVATHGRDYSLTSQKRLCDIVGSEYGLTRFVEQIIKFASERDELQSLCDLFAHCDLEQVKEIVELLVAEASRLHKDKHAVLDRITSLGIDSIITDLQFDAILDVMRSVIQSFDGALPEHVSAFADLCESFRGPITKSYRIRREEAIKSLKTSVELGDGLIASLGGESGIENLVQEAIQSSHADLIKPLSTAIVAVCHGEDTFSDLKAFSMTHWEFDQMTKSIVQAMPDHALKNEMELAILSPFRNLLTKDSVGGSTRSLYDQYGGESAVEQVVEIAVEKIHEGGLRVFFDISRSRFRAFKRRLTRYLCTLLGGPASTASKTGNANEFSSHSTVPFGSNLSAGSGKSSSAALSGGMNHLRQTHWNLNITDTHFDAFVEVILESARELGVLPELIAETKEVLNSVRADVVIGWTTRSHEAEVRASRHDTDSVYEQLGGNSSDPGLEGFLDRFYDLIERDRRINEFFLGSKFNAIKHAQGTFFVSLLGGPVASSRPLDEVHSIYNISDYHFDCLCKILLSSARDCGASPEAIDDIAVTIEPFREAITSGCGTITFPE